MVYIYTVDCYTSIYGVWIDFIYHIYGVDAIETYPISLPGRVLFKDFRDISQFLMHFLTIAL
jgi:hypothetical protein